ncbi:embryonic polarity protein dorsal-like isoform X2 [Schistocerca nitens]|uniref:embryonic polarity protein dorsal-like isoform X2 n=1 Tax=Schistocerca nitens TaxID=7011 RepID=UPI002117D24E|nr:embryonic polarity protein dorsal-like isoform X2 [Schistocerca nitens]
MERLDAAVSLGGVGGGMDHEHLNQGSLNISDVSKCNDKLLACMIYLTRFAQSELHAPSYRSVIQRTVEVIKTTDPEFVDSSGRMYGGGGGGPVAAATMEDAQKAAAYVRIVEQPAPKALRFRYECEGRSAGSIPGVNSTSENKTFPTIKVEGYKGRAVVVVSCVTKDPPYRPHPHNLVGKEGCKRGVCTVEISPDNMTASFSNLGIQCVKKKDIDEALKTREEIRVDPFRTGFAHRSQPTSIDLNAVRLCFQVFLEGSERGKFTFQLPPVVSDPIYDKKAMSDLVICKLSDCTATVAGGKEIILLCEKVAKEDIQVRFFEEQGGQVMWEGFGEFQPTQVHKQVAICLRTPRYRTLDVDRPVRAHIQLRRPSDGATSEPLPFELIPLESDPKRKRPKEMRIPEVEKAMLQQFGSAMYGSSVHQLPIQTTAQGLEQKPSPQLQMQMPVLHHPTIKREPVETVTTPGPSPYMFAGAQSPMFVGAVSASASPAHSVGRTPSPMDYVMPQPQQQQPQQPPPHQHPHHQQQQQQQQQNYQMEAKLQEILAAGRLQPAQFPSQAHTVQHPTVQVPQQRIADVTSGAGGGTELLDLDSQQLSLGNIDSGDLANFGLFYNSLSENLSSNLNLTDGGGAAANTEAVGGTNMTDSLTRLANTTMQDICSLNSMYKGTGH